MKNTFVTGISGTGKTTIARVLEARSIRAISIDEVPDLCSWINRSDGTKVDYEAKLDRAFIDSHAWMCDITQLKKILSEGSGTVVLGVAENQDELIQLFEKVILLQSSPETFLKRIHQRKDNDFGKDETAQQYLLDVYQDFENRMLAKGAVSIDVEEPIDVVVDRIISEIEKE